MKKLILILVLVITTTAIAQDAYSKGMQAAFLHWKEGNSTEASNIFERISAAELDNWLPYYYVAQINTIASFGEQDAKKLKQQLNKAQEFVDLAKVISPNNPEIIVLQAMVHTAWIAFDGAAYGMTLSGKVAVLYAKALQLAPKNPRVVFPKAEWDMGSAKYFGKDRAPYCADVVHSLELFATFKLESELHPNWGKERAEEIVKNCN
jgi:hypothetical protein